jgi:hypothetical protein
MTTKIRSGRLAIAGLSTLLIVPACVSTSLETPGKHPANPQAPTAPLSPTLPFGSASAAPSAQDTPVPGGHQHDKPGVKRDGNTQGDTAPASVPAPAPAHGAGH